MILEGKWQQQTNWKLKPLLCFGDNSSNTLTEDPSVALHIFWKQQLQGG